MKLLRFAFLQISTVVLVISAPGAALAQARLAPPNRQQERCIEAFADTPEEKSIRQAYGEPPREIDSIEGWDRLGALDAWGRKRAIEVFGSEKAARAAAEKVRIAKYTRRFELLRKNAKDGHLPSLYLLASHPTDFDELQGIRGLPTREESSAAYQTLYRHHFPLAARMMADECSRAIAEEFPEPAEPTPLPLVDGKIQKRGTDIEILCDPDPSGHPDLSGHPAPSGHGFCANPDEAEARLKALEVRRADEARQEALRLAEIGERRESCLELLREAGFRGDRYAWERLASYDDSHPPPPKVGIVPPVEHYAWLELEKLAWRESGWEDEYSVPRMHQEDLARDFMDEEQRREALALAQRYARIIWPRRIARGSQEGVCRLIPQFEGDPDPHGSDASPR